MIDREIKSEKAWRSDLFPAIKFYHLPEENSGCSPHFHIDYDFSLINSGAINYKINNRRKTLLEKQVFLMNPGQVHSGISIEKATPSISNIRIEPDFVWEILDKLEVTMSSLPSFNENALISKEIIESFYRFHSLSRSKKNIDILRISEEAWQFFGLIFNNKNTIYSQKRLTKSLFQTILDYLNDNIHSNITLPELAKLVNLSEYHFLRQFKKNIGLTPHQYLMRLRLEKAVRLLSSKHSISEIALSVGLSDQSHMNKLFRNQLGTTPKQLQKIFNN